MEFTAGQLKRIRAHMTEIAIAPRAILRTGARLEFADWQLATFGRLLTAEEINQALGE